MIVVWGLDWKTASLSVREQIALPEEREEFFLRDVRGLPGIQGCVLISTCNRFEVYMDARDGLDVEALLRQCLGLLAPRAGMADAGMYHFEGEGARRRLLEVACGLHSQILGEEQILTQVRQAVEKARAAATTTAVLETLFRIAVTAGKASRTQVQIKALAPSTAAKAVALAQNALGALAGRRALVIGNGEMGRLAAELLVEAGCRVTITLRSYRHGKTLVPPGCQTVAYDARAQFMNGCDLVVSATRSPHYTITEGMMAALDTPPPVLVDMAMPRDVQPACRPYCRAAFFDMDDLRDGEEKACGKELAQIHAVIEKQMDDFEKWMRGRSRQQAEKEGVAVFAGTSEGRLLCGHLAREGVAATVFVATEYGRAVLPRLPGLTVLAGRLDAEEMAAALGAASTVVDATHPYAVEASQNIKQAAGRAGARYLRLLRPRQALSQAVETVPDTAAAVRFLQDTEGPVLLTTGSKELPAYTGIPGFETRLHARVLPDAAVVERCRQLGFAPQNLICMQGPFSHELNVALLRSIGARWLVTKNTGRAGGLLQKLSAAEEAGAKVLLIERPAQEPQGYTLEQLCRMLAGAPLQQARRTVSRFPLFVEIQNRPCLVVGGGNVGKRRAGVLQEFGAQVTVVEPEAAALPDGVRVLRRGYQKGDADGMALVVAATGSRRVNAGVARECAEKNIPVSVADCPEESSFYFPAICQSEELTAGIVSQKKNHTLVAQCAGAVRRMMKEAGW